MIRVSTESQSGHNQKEKWKYRSEDENPVGSASRQWSAIEPTKPQNKK